MRWFATCLAAFVIVASQPRTAGAQDATPVPAYITALEQVFGPPSSAAFGSAVFFVTDAADGSLDSLALEHYRQFVGDLWERYGEDAWMGPWRKVYQRAPGSPADIVSELQGLSDREASSSAEMLIDGHENPGQARTALAAVFDDAQVTELAVFNLGDGGAMSGLLVAAYREAGREAVFLLFLMD